MSESESSAELARMRELTQLVHQVARIAPRGLETLTSEAFNLLSVVAISRDKSNDPTNRLE